jgi:superfamily II DNA or RNA helicase
MTERRRFAGGERTALFLAADGRCMECGAELEPGWHSDHVTPWSKGGPTDVVNGQALCPRCNEQKGDRLVSLHPWQDEALRGFLTQEGDYLCVATPGSGKTRFALAAAQQLMNEGQIGRCIVIVPTRHLRQQWAAVAHALFGIQLDADFENRYGALARDFDGVVVTYAAIGSQPLLYRHHVGKETTLVILDEIHHAGHERSWGKALRQAFELAHRRLLLSGTPFRTSGEAIPFVNYDGEGYAKAHKRYSYGEALSDGIVRPMAFAAFDGEVRWRAAGAITSTGLSKADEEARARALAVALDPEGEWIGSVLEQADRELSRQREVIPDAGGLVIAADQFKARRYATMLERISGERVTVAISDEPNASDRIAQFTRAKSRWIVAVQMISEGVDIPRLAVGVYASDYRTQLFFEQVVGRFVRLRNPADETCATLFIPSVEPILTYAREIEKLVPLAMRAAEERARDEAKDSTQMILDLVASPAWEPAGSSEATHYATILGGEELPDAELRRADEFMRLAGMPASVTPAQVARLLRLAGAGRVVGTAQVQAPPTLKLADQKRPLRQLVNKKVNQLAVLEDRPHSHLHAELNKECHDTVPTATVETLNRRLEILDRRLDLP